jgi:hypothetical protein
MPFQSDKQRSWMYANEPEMAKEWSAEEKGMKASEKQKKKQKSQADHIRKSSASNAGGASVGGGT